MRAETNQKIEKELLDMQLHDRQVVGDMYVRRVLGGWLYFEQSGTSAYFPPIFVPEPPKEIELTVEKKTSETPEEHLGDIVDDAKKIVADAKAETDILTDSEKLGEQAERHKQALMDDLEGMSYHTYKALIMLGAVDYREALESIKYALSVTPSWVRGEAGETRNIIQNRMVASFRHVLKIPEGASHGDVMLFLKSNKLRYDSKDDPMRDNIGKSQN